MARLLSAVLLISVGLTLGGPAFAQDGATTVFILPPQSNDAVLERALTDELGAFREALTITGNFRIAADREMESVVSECREQINAAPADERECQLQAARVAAMDHVLELIGREVGGGRSFSASSMAATPTSCS